MFIETRPSWNKAPEERNIHDRLAFYLRSFGAKDIVDLRVSINIWPLRGQSFVITPTANYPTTAIAAEPEWNSRSAIGRDLGRWFRQFIGKLVRVEHLAQDFKHATRID